MSIFSLSLLRPSTIVSLIDPCDLLGALGCWDKYPFYLKKKSFYGLVKNRLSLGILAEGGWRGSRKATPSPPLQKKKNKRKRRVEEGEAGVWTACNLDKYHLTQRKELLLAKKQNKQTKNSFCFGRILPLPRIQGLWKMEPQERLRGASKEGANSEYYHIGFLCRKGVGVKPFTPSSSLETPVSNSSGSRLTLAVSSSSFFFFSFPFKQYLLTSRFLIN